MGILYRRKKKDPVTGRLVETGPYWMKYYREGRPYCESTKTRNNVEAKRKLKVREGEVATGTFRGPLPDRTRFEDLVADLRSDYLLKG